MRWRGGLFRQNALLQARGVSLRRRGFTYLYAAGIGPTCVAGSMMPIANPTEGIAMNIVTRPVRRIAAALMLALAGGFVANALAATGGAGGHAIGGGPLMGGMLPRMLDRVNATPEQRAQIQQIIDRNAAERQAQREARREMREQAMALFSQPTVDANAVEALRQKQMALADAASKRMTASMLEISRVLTPEQRAQIASYMSQRGEMMRRHYRERQAIDAPKS